MTASIRALVTGVGGGSVGAQVAKALLMDAAFKVFVATADPVTVARVWGEETVHLPSASSPHYVESVLEEVRRLRIDAVVPGSNAETELMAKHHVRSRLHDEGVYVAVNDERAVDIGSDQSATNRFLQGEGIDCPKFSLITQLGDVDRVDFLPAVLKPQRGSGSRFITIAQTVDELVCQVKTLLVTGAGCVAQEYVGVPELEFTVGVVRSQVGEELSLVAMRRLLSGLSLSFSVPNRSGRADLGPVLAISSGLSQGVFGHFAAVEQTSREVASALGTTAAMNVQCRLADDRPVVFEVNPRFSGSTSLRAIAGVNEPARLLRWELMGERTPNPTVRTCTVLRHLNEVLVTDDGSNSFV